VYTECPNCHTLFRIGVEQLKAASGKAHCCRCDQVFNALDNLRTRTEKSDAWPESRLIDNLQEQQNLPFDGLLQSPKDPEVSISSLIDTFEVEDSLPIIDPLANSETTQNSDPFEPDLDLSDLDMDSLQLNIEDSLSRSEFSPDSKPAPAEETQLHTVESSLDAFDPSIEISGFGIDSNLFEFDSDALLSSAKPDPIPEFELSFEAEAASDFESRFTSDHEPELGHEPEPEHEPQLGYEPKPEYKPEPEPELEPQVESNSDHFTSDSGTPSITQDQQNSPDIIPADTTSLEDLPEPPTASLSDLPDLPASTTELLPVEELLASNQPHRNNWGWAMAILLMLCIGLLQITWFARYHLIENEQGRQWVSILCQQVECSLPPEVAPEQFAVLARSIVSHPTADDALLVKLTATNQAPFPQQAPLLQLSLFDRNEALIARRAFSPRQYLISAAEPTPSIPAGGMLHVEIALADPGDKATGFKFEFY